MADIVNHPKHYRGKTSIECIDAMELIFGADGMAYILLGNAFKYLWRHEFKNQLEDLAKAEWYLTRYEEEYYGSLPFDFKRCEVDVRLDELYEKLNLMLESEKVKYHED